MSQKVTSITIEQVGLVTHNSAESGNINLIISKHLYICRQFPYKVGLWKSNWLCVNCNMCKF